MVKFARATGDIHALSSADMRLIALAHGLEVGGEGFPCRAVCCYAFFSSGRSLGARVPLPLPHDAEAATRLGLQAWLVTLAPDSACKPGV